MLAWFHQNLASELELIGVIFPFSKEDAVRTVGHIGAGLSRPFAARMHEVFKGPSLDVVLAHELRSLVQFYRVTLTPSLLPADCALAVALAECQVRGREKRVQVCVQALVLMCVRC